MAVKILIPSAVKRELRRFGADIKEARLKRNLPMQLIAERAMTTRQTVGRIEDGDPTVSFGTVLAVLNALGLLGGIARVATPENDPLGRELASEQMRKRARSPGTHSRKAP